MIKNLRINLAKLFVAALLATGISVATPEKAHAGFHDCWEMIVLMAYSNDGAPSLDFQQAAHDFCYEIWGGYY